jgi:transposase
LIDLPEQKPAALLADRAYDTDAIRADLKERGIKPVIPPKSNRTKTICYTKRFYRQRNCIERVLGHLKINRAIATRYDDQLADSFLGMLAPLVERVEVAVRSNNGPQVVAKGEIRRRQVIQCAHSRSFIDQVGPLRDQCWIGSCSWARCPGVLQHVKPEVSKQH